MNQIILATVNVKEINYGITSSNFAAIAPNIPMGLLHAYLQGKGVPVDFIDSDVENYSIDELLGILDDEKPSLVCLVATGSNPSASTMSMVGINKFFEKLQQRGSPSYKTCVYGGHPTALPERTLKETQADFIVISEGYDTLEGLYHAIKQKDTFEKVKGIGYYDESGHYIENNASSLIDVTKLPRVDWDKMNPHRYRAHNWHCFDDINSRTPYAIVWTNMGCPYPCDFCSINNIFRKRTFRNRSMEQVIAEIDYLVQNFGVRNIKILDELFVIKHPRIDEFCELLEKRTL